MRRRADCSIRRVSGSVLTWFVSEDLSTRMRQFQQAQDSGAVQLAYKLADMSQE